MDLAVTASTRLEPTKAPGIPPFPPILGNRNTVRVSTETISVKFRQIQAATFRSLRKSKHKWQTQIARTKGLVPAHSNSSRSRPTIKRQLDILSRQNNSNTASNGM